MTPNKFNAERDLNRVRAGALVEAVYEIYDAAQRMQVPIFAVVETMRSDETISSVVDCPKCGRVVYHGLTHINDHGSDMSRRWPLPNLNALCDNLNAFRITSGIERLTHGGDPSSEFVFGTFEKYELCRTGVQYHYPVCIRCGEQSCECELDEMQQRLRDIYK